MDAARNTITRRGALGRLFGLGAGAAATAVALPPAPVHAEPVTVEVLPDWLASAPEWVSPALERIVRVLPDSVVSRPPENGSWNGDDLEALRDRAFLDYVAELAERCADPDWFTVIVSHRMRGNEAEPVPDLEITAEPGRGMERIEDQRVATARIRRLTPNERRRVRRWIARQPKGHEHPVIRLRAGRRRDHELDQGYDFIDVAKPVWGSGSQVGARECVFGVVYDVGALLGEPLMAMVLCSHDARVINSMYVVDGRTTA